MYNLKDIRNEHLMSNLFIASEVALASMPLKEMISDSPDILIGGLGLGYTAREVLSHQHVKSLTIIEYLEPVISWHQKGILPIGKLLFNDARCDDVLGDFFKYVIAIILTLIQDIVNLMVFF